MQITCLLLSVEHHYNHSQNTPMKERYKCYSKLDELSYTLLYTPDRNKWQEGAV